MQDILHKTLIIRFSSVGDIVLSTLLVRVLRRRFPQSQIDYLVKSEFADLIRWNPYLTHVHELHKGGSLCDLAALRRTIKAENYDLIIDIHDSLRSRFICLGTRRVVRIHKRKIARFLLVRAHQDLYRLFGGAPGVAGRYLETVSAFGLMDDQRGLELFPPVSAHERANIVLLEKGINPGMSLFGICPSAKHDNKMWIQERFAEAAQQLAHEAGAGVLLFGSDQEYQRCAEIERLIRRASAQVPVANLAGSLSLIETAAMMNHCSLVLTNDSGLMHIAAAQKRPVVAIFGPTVRQFGFFPFGTRSMVVEHPALSCRPCTHIGLPSCPKGHFRCMKDIPSQQVIEAARQLLIS